MKKILVLLLSLVLCLGLTGCVTSYTPPQDGVVTPPTDGPGTGDDSEVPFTVNLSYKGKPYYPEIALSAQWSNKDSLTTAEFENGVATVYGLDGNYQVTITDLPYGLAYNPNDYFASNKNKDVTIELMDVTIPFGQGTGFFSKAYKMTQTGLYGVDFSAAGQIVYCNFKPPERGSYIIESIMDTSANEINPRLEYYSQNTSWVPPTPQLTVKDGGAASAYTRNFRYNAEIDGDCINFTIRCDSLIDYPVTVYFVIEYADDYSRDPVYEMKEPEQLYDANGNLKTSPEPSGSFVKCGMETGNPNHILDSKKFDLGEDGYYHLKNEDGSLSSSIVYADLTEFFAVRNETSESGESYVVLTNLKIGRYDYTYFIKGWEGLLQVYGTELNVPEKYQHLKDGEGYDATVISKSPSGKRLCAVTEELREFLHRFSAKNQYFFDGMGQAEQNGYNSSDADQWLYFCGYFI